MSESTEFVKLVVRFTEEILMGSESLWAKPRAAGGDDVEYVLHNVSIFCGLAPDDVVCAELNGDSQLQITQVRSVANRCVAGLHLAGAGGLGLRDSQHIPPSGEVTEHASVALARRLEARGAHVEGSPGALTTSWPLNMGADQVRQRIAQAMAGHDGWTVTGVWSAADRADGFQELIDPAVVPPA